MPTEFIVSRDKLKSFLPLLGAEVTEDDHIRDIESQDLVGNDDEALTTDEIGYLGEGSIEPVEDDFSSIVAHLSDRDLRDED
ncbi:hypothetical protein HZS55_13505 [Halosimplex rubrum]|uniref:Uncharacterized protein n=1 Tax=Halosimplex rubrum TaxID=869889 RepID=A0A7D5P650_9EURY|nr:hypothetical protein [Halosimplex rubrum]QLH78262.1 hypothetical protein HZS55_13505 [Halosimplex rubrum]